jgi:hypothetical protein
MRRNARALHAYIVEFQVRKHVVETGHMNFDAQGSKEGADISIFFKSPFEVSGVNPWK